ncbi:MAG TPA: DEAD/DEAH box helicase [Gemmataceae bacterium]|nr:DEAD/DEAH box helicase [Gemmataceae bacterium]
MSAADPLDLFLPAVAQWFRRDLGAPTPVQRQGWPLIAAGQSTLLLAPTGSGKTLAAFLACLDGLWRQNPIGRGVQVLYISPLKALNNDIYRNLQVPLAGVEAIDPELPKIHVGVRTGDTPPAERQRLLRHPPQVLITTPESLHLLLTSRAREALRNVTHCIVDEIHALCPNKRGVFLALLLERLQTLVGRDFVRIGLSATQRPLEEVARYLGGFAYDKAGQWRERPVAIVDAGLRKNLDLQVVSPVEQFGPLPEKSVWPALSRRLVEEIRRHRSTIIFANNRRSVERLTSMLNEALAEAGPWENEAPREGEAPRGGIPTREGEAPAQPRTGNRPSKEHVSESTGSAGASPSRDALSSRTSHEEKVLVRAHHGSVALEVRQQTEQALKEGRLRAVVATASLELGIDMGAVDLVCQVESPGNVARGLQRVGRAGHLVGQSSKGRLIPKTLPDLLNEAVLAAEMAAGRVEMLRVPMNCLDVLAQQIIAMTAMEDWPVTELYHVICQAYPYRDLTPGAFDAVLEMVSGRYRFTKDEALTPGPSPKGKGGTEPRLSPAQRLTALQPRISWDRVHQRLQALPGSQRLAVVSGGTIPDTGQYAVYTVRGLRIGEVDEEFVYERRVGDTFLLGTNAWRVDRIDADRVIVTPAEGVPAMAPFWRGEQSGRSYDLGLAQGRFLRTLSERIDDTDCLDWLQRDYFLDSASAHNLRDYVRRQKHRVGCVPSDRTLVIEASRDPLGDWQVIILSPLGRAVNYSLRLAIEHRLHARLGYHPQCLHHDDGVLFRLTESEEPVVDLFAGLTPDNVRDMILEELADSALFALRFRQNAARALMMPRVGVGKRAPLWLQRLRGRDLLQVARQHPDFPIVAETFRECLHDHLDLPHLQQLLTDIASGAVEVQTRRLDVASPFASSLLFAFTMAFMYEYDDVDAKGGNSQGPLDQGLVDQLIGRAGPLPLEPRAVQQLDRRLRNVGLPPRSKAETAEWLRRLGDASPRELEGPVQGFLAELEQEGVVQRIDLRTSVEPTRWILTEEAEQYRVAFAADVTDAEESHAAAAAILRRFLETHALVGLDDILQRYPLERGWATQQLEEWTKSGRLLRVEPSAAEPLQWSAPENFEQMQRGTLSVLRREVITCPASQFADFLARWQYLHPATQTDDVRSVLQRLQGFLTPAELWEHAILPSRVRGLPSPSGRGAGGEGNNAARQLDEAIAAGQWTWYCGRVGESDATAFLERGLLASLPTPTADNVELDQATSAMMEVLRQRGALFASEVAAQAGLSVSATRTCLWSLLRGGVVSNDQYEVFRKGEPPREDQPPLLRSRGELRAFMRDSRRRQMTPWPEGRWSLLAWGHPDPETAAFTQARLLLDRYGIVSRELALLSGTPTSWRVLYEVLSRLELTGDVRRGYFVEGLSGAQFAWPDAAKMLQEIALPSQADAPVLLVHSLDPANLYGSGAPWEALPSRAFPRRLGNWIAVKAGVPLLLIEHHGKRLIASPQATPTDLAGAAARLPELLRGMPGQHKLTVESWNEQPVTGTIGKDLLEAAGFVRDYQAMTLYANWGS